MKILSSSDQKKMVYKRSVLNIKVKVKSIPVDSVRLYFLTANAQWFDNATAALSGVGKGI